MYTSHAQGSFKKIFLGTFIVLVISFFSATIIPSVVEAASLGFSPTSGSYASGSTFTVGVYASSPTQSLNAVSGVISFPPDTIQVTNISKNGSIVNFWVTEPSFSNASGTVSFEGVALNPGYIGASGKIITIQFKAKNPGDASLAFTTGSILANDGLGTSILSERGTAQFTITPPIPSPEVPKEIITPQDGINIEEELPIIEKTSEAIKESKITELQPSREPLSISIGSWKIPFYVGLFVLIFVITILSGGISYWWHLFFLREKNKRNDHEDGDLFTGKIRATGTVVDKNSTKALLLIKKRLEKHLEFLQRIRKSRILTKEEKKIKEAIENDLDEIDNALEN